MNVLGNFARVKVLVIGDIMLDRYWWGSVKRISPEAPVPVVQLKESSYVPGGAANVAVNIAGLGATPYLIGGIGKDSEGESLVKNLERFNVSPDCLVQLPNRPTIVKTRVIAHNQQVVRIDQEITTELSEAEETLVWDAVSGAVSRVDLIIVSDYAKGLLTKSLLSRLMETARGLGKMVLVDPKGKDYSKYLGAAMLTPNRREAAEACNLDESLPDLVRVAGEQLLDDLALESLLITQSEDGMTLFRKDAKAENLASNAKEIYDVTGAGDTVIACMAVGIGAGLDFLESAKIANIGAGIVVEQVGTTSITAERLKKQLEA